MQNPSAPTDGPLADATPAVCPCRQTAPHLNLQEVQDHWTHEARSFITTQQLAQRFPHASLWDLHLRDITEIRNTVVYLVMEIPILQELTPLEAYNLKMLQFLEKILIMVWKIEAQKRTDSARFHSLRATSCLGSQQAPVVYHHERPREPPIDFFRLGPPPAWVVRAFEPEDSDIAVSSAPIVEGPATSTYQPATTPTPSTELESRPPSPPVNTPDLQVEATASPATNLPSPTYQPTTPTPSTEPEPESHPPSST